MKPSPSQSGELSRAKRMTKEQREWCRKYQRETGFEPLMGDFEAGNENFKFCANKSVKWFEDWSNDAHLNISRHIPGANE